MKPDAGPNFQLHICLHCRWARCIPRETAMQNAIMTHPYWGTMSVRQAAEKDVAAHNCNAAEYAKMKAKLGIDWLREEKLSA